jgi:hypothetical protein
MKKILPFLVLSAAAAWAQPDVVPAPVTHLYVPAGFDSNDTVEVVVTGNFPNSCYSRNDVKVDVRDEEIAVTVTAVSHEKSFPAARCSDMLVPFKEVVHIGNLQGGDYKLIVNNRLTDSLRVGEASSNSVDENLYAAIEWVEEKGGNNVLLHGWRYSNCIDHDRVEVKSNDKDTLAILPVMKRLSDFCPMKMMPVRYPVKLDFASLKMRQPLLHVRTMDGKSVNAIIRIEERR